MIIKEDSALGYGEEMGERSLRKMPLSGVEVRGIA
jgi:hypothetical protein